MKKMKRPKRDMRSVPGAFDAFKVGDRVRFRDAYPGEAPIEGRVVRAGDWGEGLNVSIGGGRVVEVRNPSSIVHATATENTQIGPRGGKYIIGPNGKKYYPVKGRK